MKSTNADLLKNSAIREGASEKRRGRGGGGEFCSGCKERNWGIELGEYY